MDGHPKIISESQEAGLPIVAFTSDASGTGEIIENKKTGVLVPEGDISAFSTNILELLNNKKLSDKIKIDAQKFVEEYFSDDNFLSTFT